MQSVAAANTGLAACRGAATQEAATHRRYPGWTLWLGSPVASRAMLCAIFRKKRDHVNITHWKIACVAALMCIATLANAHTNVASTSPKSGAVLERSPPTIEIKFEHPVRMTSVVVLAAAAQPERKLQFSPTESARTFTVTDPALAPGRNEIQWKALSRDGHVISGSLILVIKPATP